VAPLPHEEREVPKWFLELLIEDAQTPTKPYAIRYYTSGVFLPRDPFNLPPIPVRLPDGRIIDIRPTETLKLIPTEKYCRVWREYDNPEEAIKEARGWLKTEISNYYVQELKGWKPKWEPIQVIHYDRGVAKVIREWSSVQEAELELGITRKEAYQQIGAERREL